MAYAHTNKKNVLYYLHAMEVKLKSSKFKQKIYYFSRKAGKFAIDELPENYKVIESKRTGLPLLKKK
jgi:hypothetical protein